MTLLAAVLLIHSWYPAECCSVTRDGANDCHPIACDELLETTEGIRWKDLLFRDNQVHPSLDRQCHVCDHTYGANDPHPHHGYCVFVQPSS